MCIYIIIVDKIMIRLLRFHLFCRNGGKQDLRFFIQGWRNYQEPLQKSGPWYSHGMSELPSLVGRLF